MGIYEEKKVAFQRAGKWGKCTRQRESSLSRERTWFIWGTEIWLMMLDSGWREGGSKWAEEVGRSQNTRVFIGCTTRFRFYYKQGEVMEAFQAIQGQIQLIFWKYYWLFGAVSIAEMQEDMSFLPPTKGLVPSLRMFKKLGGLFWLKRSWYWTLLALNQWHPGILNILQGVR